MALRQPVASTSRLLITSRRCYADIRDDRPNFFGTARPATGARRDPNWVQHIPGRAERAARHAEVRFNRRSSRINDTLNDAPVVGQPSNDDHRSAAATQAMNRGRPQGRPNTARSRRAVQAAKRFVLGQVAGIRRMRQMDSHSWNSKCGPPPPESVLGGKERRYLPPLDLTTTTESQLAIQPQETRDGVVSKSWWRITAPPEPLTSDEAAGDYARWTKSYFAKPAPRTRPDIPSWTETLDATLPRNRTMTLAQKRLFARTVEKLVAGNGVIKEMTGKSYVAPVAWPRKKELQQKLVGQERLPWHPAYKPLIAKNVH